MAAATKDSEVLKPGETDRWGRTELHLRAAKLDGDLEALYALGYDVNANAPMSDGTPLHKAALIHHPPHVASLLAHGARTDVKNAQGLTPLDLAVQSCANTSLKDLVEIARMLVAAGAPVTARTKALLVELRVRVAKYRKGMDAAFAAECDAAIRTLQTMI